MKKDKRNQKGMTLIEIMIVLAVLGTVLALVGQRIFGAQDRAKAKQARLAMANIQDQLEMYSADCGEYPSNLNALIDDPGDDCGGWGGPYLKKKDNLKDPWKTEFVYNVDGGSYELMSLGKDRRQGGEGVDRDIKAETN